MESAEAHFLPLECEKETLPNGIRILTEHVPHSHSVAIGVWIRAGSRVETEEESGIAHFLEHLCFKGTEKRSALDIAREIDAIGGVLNGFTSQELTCFYVKVLPDHIDIALDLLSDLVLHPVFHPDELEREREVVLREIKMVEDNPEDLLHDLFFEMLYPGNPLGRPVAGREEVIASVSRDTVVRFWKRHYAPGSVVITAAGPIRMESFRDRVIHFFSGWSAFDARSRESSLPDTPPVPLRVLTKPLEEAYLCVGQRSYPVAHPRRYALQVLNIYLGGGLSSRLFQEIREKRGLAYSVNSFMSGFVDTGVLGISLSTSPAQLKECLELIEKEIERVKAGGITEEDVQRVQEHIRGSLFLYLESTDGRMSRLARGEIYFGRPIPVPEVLEGFRQVIPDEVSEVARDVFQPHRSSLAALGKIDQNALAIPVR